MQPDLKKRRRKQLNRVYWVVSDAQPRPQQCQLNHVSEAGARITVPNAAEIPDKFILLLTEDGKAARKCVGPLAFGQGSWAAVLSEKGMGAEKPAESARLDA